MLKFIRDLSFPVEKLFLIVLSIFWRLWNFSFSIIERRIRIYFVWNVENPFYLTYWDSWFMFDTWFGIRWISIVWYLNWKKELYNFLILSYSKYFRNEKLQRKMFSCVKAKIISKTSINFRRNWNKIIQLRFLTNILC